MEEYTNTNFKHEGERIHPKKFKSKKVKSTGKRRRIDILKKDCEDRNNARNRDAYSITKSNGMLKDESNIKVVDSINNRCSNNNETEDTLILMLDLKSNKKS